MERPELNTVIAGLQEQGYRTGRAFPGERMPHIQKPAVAVALQKEESGSQTLAVTVLYPENMGGGTCEDDARVVAGYLRGMGYECVQEHCQYDGKSDRFFVRSLATWNDVQADAPYSVSIEGTLMRYTTGFSAERKTDVRLIGAMGQGAAAGFAAKAQPWTVTLEELIPRDIEEPEDPQEPFALVVQRGAIGECYGGCRWTSHYRQDTQEGLRKVRIGVALTRSIESYG